MRQFALFVFFCCAVSCIEKVHGDEVNRTDEGADMHIEDSISDEMPDPDDINAPTEDPSIADRVAAEEVDESQNDVDGSEVETEVQSDFEEEDTFTDTVQPQPADDADSKLETYSDTVDLQPSDDTSSSDS